MYAMLVEYLYFFSCEIVRLRKKVNHYTEALLKETWKKNEQFLEQYHDDGKGGGRRAVVENEGGGTPGTGRRRQKGPPLTTSETSYVVGEEEEEEDKEEAEKHAVEIKAWEREMINALIWKYEMKIWKYIMNTMEYHGIWKYKFEIPCSVKGTKFWNWDFVCLLFPGSGFQDFQDLS